jgi:predicted amidohydrolase YtcJ
LAVSAGGRFERGFRSRADGSGCRATPMGIANNLRTTVRGMGPRERFRGAACAAALLAAAGCARPDPADLVLRGGSIVTGEAAQPRVEGLAADGGRIVALGDADDIERYVGEGTRVLDLRGAVAYPGFTESHGHFSGLGRARRRLDLTGTRSWDEIVAKVRDAAAAARPGTWVVGWGWHQEKWTARPEPSVEGFPVADALDEAAGDRPVLLKHAAGSHAGIANRAALARAGVDDWTPDPQGGRFVRDGSRRLTGMLLESAYARLEAAYDADRAAQGEALREAEAEEEIATAAAECVRKGVTSFHDAGVELEEAARLRRLAEAGKLPLRLWVMLLGKPADLARTLPDVRIVGAANGFFTMRALKRELDGALGSRTAWLLAPYADRPETTGINTEPVADLEGAAELALEHDLQVCVHAIGDRAVRESLDALERVLHRHDSEPKVRKRGMRWRIEHAQHVDPRDLPRFAALKVIASMQGVHAVSDGPWVPLRLGPERARATAYLWRSLLDRGVVIANGTDAPIEDVDPLAGFRALVTRRTRDGTAFFPEQRMTREEALRAMTWAPAYAAFEERERGTLAVGKLADLTVVDLDLLEAPEEALARARVVATVVNGRVVFEEPGAQSRKEISSTSNTSMPAGRPGRP